MALSLSKNRARGSVGLDLDGGFIAAVSTESGRIIGAVAEELPSGLVVDGEVSDGDALTESLKRFFDEHKLPRRVRLGVANQQIVMRQLELPMIQDERDLAAAVRFQAAEAIAMPLDETVLDHIVLGPVEAGDGTQKLRVVVVAARESMIERFVSSVRGAGLKPDGIDLNAFALVRTLASEVDDEEPARVYCHLGAVTNLAVAVGRHCTFTRPLSAAWDDEDDHLAASLAEEIRLSIDFYMAQPEARPAEELVLSGPGSADGELVSELQPLLHLPIRVAEPLGTLETSAIAGDPNPHRYTVAAGLALGAAA
jgi:type IV pilus assembly protein PilM